MTRADSPPNWIDMQGLILSSYPHLHHAVYLAFRIINGREAQIRRWLRTLLPHVTPAWKGGSRDGYPEVNFNVALTYTGLGKLTGAAENDLQGFCRPFIEGIHGSDHRRRILGDTGNGWGWGGQHEPVDVLLMSFGLNQELLDAAIEGALAGASDHIEFIWHQNALPLNVARGREHFGFVDGISQPILKETSDAERFPESIHLTELGEFVLGYRNADGLIPEPPSMRRSNALLPIGLNGSYLVLRQLEQSVPDFWSFCEAQAGPGANQLAAKIIGREVDGTPLVPNMSGTDNEFGFADDQYGYGCPLGSHVRRANPRDSFDNNNVPGAPPATVNRHRILRRGRPYGPIWDKTPEDKQERGLMFLCLNSDIERQFEFIQQNWINGRDFSGLADESDPLIGARAPIHRERYSFTIPGLPAPHRISGLREFVRSRGGEYFFLPGITALQELAHD